MTPERIVELRQLAESRNSIPVDRVTLSAKEFIHLLNDREELKGSLRAMLETHIAIDPPATGPCPECLTAIAVLASIDEPVA